jgi:TolB-like protein/class 3 adenylate cyclase
MVQERPVRVERRLAAILAADVAGYSRLMHRDEEATHAKLTAVLTEAVHPTITEHGGRIVKNTGDGFLAEFPSAVQAVRAAAQFQTRVRELTAGDAEAGRIAFRIGINVGDVIVEPNDIFGDGVNIAARLESIAKPGGICIAAAAYDQVRGKVDLQFADLGEQNLKNIDLPVRAYDVIKNGCNTAKKVERIGTDVQSPPRLSIVVLPFANLSGNPEHDYFVNSVTESLTTDLSRCTTLFVIARNRALPYRAKEIDIRQVGLELNVRYVLEGSMQRYGDRLRVNVQLIEAESGKHLWAERFEKPMGDLFDLQDEIVSRLVHTLYVQVVSAAARRAERMLSPDAKELTFLGTVYLYKGWTPEYIAQARDFFERALTLNSQLVGALFGLANVDIMQGASLLTDEPTACLSAAEPNAIKALSLAPGDANVHLTLGAIYIFTNRAIRGVAECEHALTIDRNLANAHGFIGLAKVLLGRAVETENQIREAFRLSPCDMNTNLWMYFLGLAKIHLGEDADAVSWLRRSIETNRNMPLAHFALAAALGLLGAQGEARGSAQTGLAMNPGFTIRRMCALKPSDNPTFLIGEGRICEGMRLAGVPEG